MKQKSSVGFVGFSAFLHAAVLLGFVMVPALKMLPEGDDTVVEIVTETAAPAPVKPAPRPVVAKATPAKKSPKIVAVDMSKDVSDAPEQAEEVTPVAEEAPAKSSDPEQEVVDTAASDAAAEAVAKQEEMDKLEPLPAPVAKQPVQKLSDIKETPVTGTPGDKSGNTLAEVAGPMPDELRSNLELKQLGNNRPPQYPVVARRNGFQGEVVLNYYVTKQGLVQELKVGRSSGYPELDQEALRAVSRYKYVAGQEGWTAHPVQFSLKGPTAAQPGRLRTSGSSVQGE